MTLNKVNYGTLEFLGKMFNIIINGRSQGDYFSEDLGEINLVMLILEQIPGLWNLRPIGFVFVLE